MKSGGIIIFILCFFFSCENKRKEALQVEKIFQPLNSKITILEKKFFSKEALKLKSMGLIDVRESDSTILVDLKYATTDNFTKTSLYQDLRDAYLQPDVACMLVKAQRYLDSIRPGMRLLIYDAVRPVSVQKKMYESIQNSPDRIYVAHPDRTGLHNYGAAVDLTICDSTLNPLDMGTPFDSFSRKSGINSEEKLIREGLLTRQQVNNRKLLRKVMTQAGFQTIRGEWWHFNACSLNEAKKRYQLIESL